MTKKELIEQVAEDCKLARGRAEVVVKAVFDCIIEAMSRDEGVEIRSFGSFTVRHYKAYEGRNPLTGDVVHVAPKRLPFFKMGKELRERVNRGPLLRAQAKVDASPSHEGARTAASTRARDASEDVI